MKEHLQIVHDAMASHHGRMASMHKDHADALDDGDAHASFHRAVAQEHQKMEVYHRACSKALADQGEMPSPELFDPADHAKVLLPADPRARWSKAMVPTDVVGVVPDNKSLADRGLRLAPRFGAPTVADTIEDVASDLDPELRKAIC